MQREVAQIVEAVHGVQPIRRAELLRTNRISSAHPELLIKPVPGYKVVLLLSGKGRPLSPTARKTVLEAVKTAASRVGYKAIRREAGLSVLLEGNTSKTAWHQLHVSFERAGNQRARRLDINVGYHPGDPEIFRALVRKLGIGAK